MIKHVLAATVAGLFSASLAAAPNHWPALAKTDLDFVYQTIAANHPGAIDSQNPYFKEWMERGYAEAQTRVTKAASLADAAALVTRYVAGFADGHLAVRIDYQRRRLNWAGVMVARQGTRFKVVHRAQGWTVPLPALGAALVSCDGRAADAMVDEDIAPALFNLPGSDSVKGNLAEFIFSADELAPHAEYARCIFEDRAGRQDFAMKWVSIARDDFVHAWDSANPAPGKASTITEPAPGVYWVHLPQFQPNRDQEAELKALTARMPALRAAKLIVFDIRGNGGGNSQWGEDVLAALYGKAYMDDLEIKSADHGYSEWRVSADNLAYVEGLLPKLAQQFAPDAGILLDFKGLAVRMKTALASGQPFVRQSEPEAPRKASGAAPLTRARVALITDSGCASSCLDFADRALTLPGVRHLGYATGADTVFMDVRRVNLPSGLGRMVVAQKVYRGRKRANNQAYVPSTYYDGQIGDSAKVKEWALKQLGN